MNYKYIFFCLFLTLNPFKLAKTQNLSIRIINVSFDETVFHSDDTMISVYNVDTNQTDNTPYITSSNFKLDTNKIKEYRFCAISRNLHKKYGGHFSYGDTIVISGDNLPDDVKGQWIVQDLKKSNTGVEVDLLVPHVYKGGVYGLWKKVTTSHIVKRKFIIKQYPDCIEIETSKK